MNSTSMDQQVAVVTGAGRGIGRSVADGLVIALPRRPESMERSCHSPAKTRSIRPIAAAMSSMNARMRATRRRSG